MAIPPSTKLLGILAKNVMKVPNIFRPEKILDEKIKSLESAKEKDIGSLTDFVLNEVQYAKFAHIPNQIYEGFYSNINKIDVVDDICISYSGNENFTPAVDIFKFQNVQIMKLSLGNIIECARNFNDRTTDLKICILVKDFYVCFAYNLDNKQKTELINSYKNKFGFEELKQ